MVTPVLKSGAYLPQFEPQDTTLSVGDDLLGYETALYAEKQAGMGACGWN